MLNKKPRRFPTDELISSLPKEMQKLAKASQSQAEKESSMQSKNEQEKKET